MRDKRKLFRRKQFGYKLQDKVEMKENFFRRRLVRLLVRLIAAKQFRNRTI